VSSESLIWLVEIEAYDETLPGIVTLRYSSDETFYDDSLNEYTPRLLRPLTLTQALFNRFATFGTSRTGVGEIALVNIDGDLDALDDYGFDGRAVRVLLGDPDDVYAGFEEVFVGTMDQAEFTYEEVRIRIRDKLALFDVPVTEAVFAGDNVGPTGVEGLPETIGGQTKRRLWGRMRNLPAPLVNRSLLIYGVNWDKDGNRAPVASFDEIRDRGVAITIAADYADLASLQGATIPNGQAATCLAEGLFRMERVFGAITCDVTESATAADNRLPRLLERIINDAGGTVQAGDVAALQATSDYEAGIWTQGQSYAQTLDRIAQSDGCYYCGARTGDQVFRLARIEVPTATSVGTIFEADGDTPYLSNYFDIIEIERRATGDQGRGIPAAKVEVLWGPIGRLMSEGDLAGTITENNPDLVEFYKVERRTAAVESASVKTKHPLAPTLTFETQLYNEADAQTVAARLSGIYSTRRQMFTVSIEVRSDLRSIVELGAVMDLRLDRWGLGASKKFLIVGAEYDASAFEYELTLWG
jgi:hypothetical protein